MKSHLTIFSLAVLAISQVLGYGNEKKNEYAPMVLKSATGVAVEVVAIYEVSPDGLTFSPKPSKPLIGSNTLATLTTSWDLIDTASIKKYPDVESAYRKSLDGKTTKMKIGSHFIEESEILGQIKSEIPRITVRYEDDRAITVLLTEFLSNKNYSRARRWSIHQRSKDLLVTRWNAIAHQIEPISYRSDILKLQYRLERAIRAVESIQTESGVFNISHANNIKELLDD
jgi:hypothetical protein